MPEVPVLNPTNETTYTVVNAGATGCSFGSGDATAERTLSFTAVGDCVIKGTFDAPGHVLWESGDITISVAPTDTPALDFDENPILRINGSPAQLIVGNIGTTNRVEFSPPQYDSNTGGPVERDDSGDPQC